MLARQTFLAACVVDRIYVYMLYILHSLTTWRQHNDTIGLLSCFPRNNMDYTFLKARSPLVIHNIQLGLGLAESESQRFSLRYIDMSGPLYTLFNRARIRVNSYPNP